MLALTITLIVLSGTVVYLSMGVVITKFLKAQGLFDKYGMPGLEYSLWILFWPILTPCLGFYYVARWIGRGVVMFIER